METFGRASLDRFVDTISPPVVHDHENTKYFAEFSDDYTNKNKHEYIPPIPESKVSLTSSNDGDNDEDSNIDNEVHDDPKELTAMREKLQDLVSKEVKSRGMSITIPPRHQQPKYTEDPKENHLISLINQQSLKDVIQSITYSQSVSPIHQIHPLVEKLYEQQQQLLQKLQLLEKDDPDPSGAKLWNIMQRIFTEENVSERQRNIEDLKSTLDEKHRKVIMTETTNDLNEMRQQLDEERKINHELRHKIRKKNRELKLLTNNDTMGRRQNINTESQDKPSAFRNWCINMGFQHSKTKCSWF